MSNARRLSSRSSNAGAAVFTSMLALLLWSCEDPSPRPQVFALRLRALSTTDQPVEGAKLWADGRELGSTAEDGTLHASLKGVEGQAVELSNACPPAYRTLDRERRIVLRRVGTDTRAPAALELTLRCEPLEQQVALVVRAAGPDSAGLPIRVGGEAVGQTAADGTAHVLLRVKPHAPLRVQLVTDAHPELLPRNPLQSFAIDDQDEVFVVEQTFARARPARPPRTPARRVPATFVPYRID